MKARANRGQIQRNEPRDGQQHAVLDERLAAVLGLGVVLRRYLLNTIIANRWTAKKISTNTSIHSIRLLPTSEFTTV
jgi:hypothetical protein